jgi:hypothetical protein
MRVLVEQTEHVARQLAGRVPDAHRPMVHVAMGGEDAGEWFLCPERPAIIIGTQDMLLSRALNRGYASARARWPMEFYGGLPMDRFLTWQRDGQQITIRTTRNWDFVGQLDGGEIRGKMILRDQAGAAVSEHDAVWRRE